MNARFNRLRCSMHVEQMRDEHKTFDEQISPQTIWNSAELSAWMAIPADDGLIG